MSQLNSKKRAHLPKSAFAYVDSKERRRLPIHDEPHVRNALARFNQVAFGGCARPSVTLRSRSCAGPSRPAPISTPPAGHVAG
jgi:hypothetical protein